MSKVPGAPHDHDAAMTSQLVPVTGMTVGPEPVQLPSVPVGMGCGVGTGVAEGVGVGAAESVGVGVDVGMGVGDGGGWTLLRTGVGDASAGEGAGLLPIVPDETGDAGAELTDAVADNGNPVVERPVAVGELATAEAPQASSTAMTSVDAIAHEASRRAISDSPS